MQSFN